MAEEQVDTISDSKELVDNVSDSEELVDNVSDPKSDPKSDLSSDPRVATYTTNGKFHKNYSTTGLSQRSSQAPSV